MGAYQDALQGAVVGFVTMMNALLNSTFNAFIGMAVHMLSSFILITALVCHGRRFVIHPFFSSLIMDLASIACFRQYSMVKFNQKRALFPAKEEKL